MTKTALSTVSRVALVAVALLGLSACNTLTRLSEIGSGPQVSGINNPATAPGYQPVSMPMPQAVAPPQSANSLWRPGARAFFKDQRAKEVGDILTVAVNIQESASVASNLARGKESSESAGIQNLLGFETQLPKILPSGADVGKLIGAGGTSTTANSGSTGRQEQLRTNVAVTIVQILPNGNLVIAGKQEIRVNHEMRQLAIQGIIRPEDISNVNTISSNKVAEARIVYGGRGVVSDAANVRYGQEFMDIILPF